MRPDSPLLLNLPSQNSPQPTLEQGDTTGARRSLELIIPKEGPCIISDVAKSSQV